MAPHGAFLRRSIGTVLHIPPTSHTLLNKKRNASNQEFPIKRFEETVAMRLTSLNSQEESQVLTVEWLKEGIQVSSATNLDAQAFIPEVQTPPSSKDEKWISKYLDYSLSILNICNKIKESIAEMDKILMLVKLILHYCTSQAFPGINQFGRVKDAVLECTTALNNSAKVTRKDLKRNGKNDMPKLHLDPKSEHVMRKQAFLEALYVAEVTTSVICSVVLAAFTGGYLTEQPVTQSFAWSFPLVSLQKTVKAIAMKRMDQGLNFIIPEICYLEFYLAKLKALLDHHGSDDVDTFKKELKDAGSDLIKDLKHHSEILEKTLKSLENEVDRLFCVTMSNRQSLLDKLKA